MNEEYRAKITEFLNPYIEVEPVGIEDGIMTEKAIIQGLKLLINLGIFTYTELKKEISKEYEIIIPWLGKEEKNETNTI